MPGGDRTRKKRLQQDIEEIIATTLREQWLVLEATPLAPVVAEIRARCEEAGLSPPSYLTVARRIPALFGPEEIAKKRSANPKHLHRLRARPGYIHAAHPLGVCQIDHTPTDINFVEVVGRKAEQVDHLLDRLKPKILIFDEFHNALRGRARDVEGVLSFLRRIGRQFDISPVLIGEVAVYDFVNQTAEMATRFDLHAVPRWRYGEEFLALLDSYRVTSQGCLPIRQAFRKGRSRHDDGRLCVGPALAAAAR